MICLDVPNQPTVLSWVILAEQSFAVWLKTNRERLGWEIKDLAAKSGVDQPLISMYEKGQRNPKPPNVKLLADAMGANLDEGLLAAGRAPKQDAPEIIRLRDEDEARIIHSYRGISSPTDKALARQLLDKLRDDETADSIGGRNADDLPDTKERDSTRGR